MAPWLQSMSPINGALREENMSRKNKIIHGLYATKKLIAKDVPISDKPKYMEMARKNNERTYRFRGRGNRVGAAYRAVNDGTWRKLVAHDHPFLSIGELTAAQEKILFNGMYSRFKQDLPLKYADRMSVYRR